MLWFVCRCLSKCEACYAGVCIEVRRSLGVAELRLQAKLHCRLGSCRRGTHHSAQTDAIDYLTHIREKEGSEVARKVEDLREEINSLPTWSDFCCCVERPSPVLSAGP